MSLSASHPSLSLRADDKMAISPPPKGERWAVTENETPQRRLLLCGTIHDPLPECSVGPFSVPCPISERISPGDRRCHGYAARESLILDGMDIYHALVTSQRLGAGENI